MGWIKQLVYTHSTKYFAAIKHNGIREYIMMPENVDIALSENKLWYSNDKYLWHGYHIPVNKVDKTHTLIELSFPSKIYKLEDKVWFQLTERCGWKDVRKVRDPCVKSKGLPLNLGLRVVFVLFLGACLSFPNFL